MVHKHQTFDGAHVAGVLSKFPFNRGIGQVFHPSGIDDNAPRLTQRTAQVPVDGASVGGLWGLHLLELPIYEKVGRLLTVFIALLDERHVESRP